MVRARGWTVWAALSVGTGVALTIHAQTASQNAGQPPSFRAGVNLVRVDVLATDRSGRSLDTLTADDFEIRENGVRQTISSFKRVDLNGDREPNGDALRAITSDAIETTEAAREDVRLFAVLLDDYHVKRTSSLWVREQLARWVETQLGPADMIGVMYPLEAMADLHLTRDRERVQAAFRRFTGRKHNYWPENDIERRYVFRLSTGEIERTRNRVTFGAIEALIARLGALKEGRKSLILVTEGFTNTLPQFLSTITEGSVARRCLVSRHAAAAWPRPTRARSSNRSIWTWTFGRSPIWRIVRTCRSTRSIRAVSQPANTAAICRRSTIGPIACTSS